MKAQITYETEFKNEAYFHTNKILDEDGRDLTTSLKPLFNVLLDNLKNYHENLIEKNKRITKKKSIIEVIV